MNQILRFTIILALILGYGHAEPLKVEEIKRTGSVDFSSEILPFLERNCLACHNETKPKADLILETPETIARGGDSGAAVVPGKPDESLLFTTAAHIEEPEMPPANNKSKAHDLAPRELGLLKRWIKEGAKGTIRSYSPAPEKWLRSKNNQTVRALAVSGDSRFAAVGRGHFIDLYDLTKLTRVARLEDAKLEFGAHLDLVYSLALSPDGTIASGGFREIKLWRKPKLTPTKFTGDLSIPPTPELLVEGAKATVTLEGKATAVTHPGAIAFSALSPSRDYIITAAQLSSASLWTTKDAKKVADLDLAPELPAALAKLKMDEAVQDRLIARYKTLVDERKKALDTEKNLASESEKTSAALQKELESAKDPAPKLEITAKLESEKRKSAANQKMIAEENARLAAAEKNLATATKKKESILAESKTLNDSRNGLIQKATIVGVGFSPDQSEVWIGMKSGAIYRYSCSNGTFLESLSTGSEIDLFLVKGDQLVTRAITGEIQQRPASTDYKLAAMIGDGKNGDILIDRIGALAFSPDGKYLISGSGIPTRVGMIKVWNPADGKLVKESKKAHTDTITSIRFNPGGDSIVSGGTDKFARVFSIPDLKPLKALEGHTGHVLGVDWSRDGQTIVTAGSDYDLKYWQVENGEITKTVKRGDYQATSVRFLNPAGDALACSFSDNTVKADATPYPESSGPTNAIELTPDGKYLLAGGEDGKLKIWTTRDRLLVKIIEP